MGTRLSSGSCEPLEAKTPQFTPPQSWSRLCLPVILLPYSLVLLDYFILRSNSNHDVSLQVSTGIAKQYIN